MALDALKPEDIARLEKVIREGMATLTELKDRKEALSDLVKHVAAEMDLKPADLNRAIKLAHKKQQDSEAVRDEHDKLETVTDILDAVNI